MYNMKICSKCKQEKELDQFYKNKGYCKKCNNEYVKEYRNNNKEKVRLINIKSNSRPEYKNKKLERDLLYYYKNIEAHKIYKAQKYINERELLLKKQNLYNKTPSSKNKRNEYNKNNEDKIRKNRNKYYHKMKNNPLFKLRNNLTVSINRLLKSKNSIKSSKSLELLGCSMQYYKQHLESQFKPEMSWSNYGKIWEVDHIIPCSKFDLINKEEQHECFHFTNTQPLFKTTDIAISFGYINEIGNRNKSNNIEKL